VNDRQANPRVGDPQECPDEPRALLRIISSWKTRPERDRRTKFAMGFLTRILFQLRIPLVAHRVLAKPTAQDLVVDISIFNFPIGQIAYIFSRPQ
jgi:hypothetical protein